MKPCHFISLALLACALSAQGLDPAKLLKPPTDTWPTYNGDYSGQRYSPLKQINAANVSSLSIQWMFRTNVGPMRGGMAPAPIKGTPLLVNGILYLTLPDYVWALNAHTGEELWHYS